MQSNVFKSIKFRIAVVAAILLLCIGICGIFSFASISYSRYPNSRISNIPEFKVTTHPAAFLFHLKSRSSTLDSYDAVADWYQANHGIIFNEYHTENFFSSSAFVIWSTWSIQARQIDENAPTTILHLYVVGFEFD